MKLSIPDFAAVLLIGTSGSGKSTFARRHFRPTEVLSSDFFRGLVADDEGSQAASQDAFAALHFVMERRLAARRLTVIDATNVQPGARAGLIALARQHHALLVALVLDVPEEICLSRNEQRPDRNFGPHVIRSQARDLRRSLKGLKSEGFHQVYVLGASDIEACQIERTPLWCDRRGDRGPFDLIGDIHGCYDELLLLLQKLGYQISPEAIVPPAGRRAVFLGDLVDRGPDSPAVLRLVMRMVSEGHALCVPGNHEVRLLKWLRGAEVRLTHGLAETVAQLAQESDDFKRQVSRFIDGLVSHYVFDSGELVVSHAGLTADMQGRASPRVRQFCLYGETTGETDEFGLPVRYDWAAEYRGQAMVVYGHTPVPAAEWVNRTLCLDTGCVFGGELTALRYPERTLVSVPAARTYYAPIKPLVAPTQSRDVLDLGDVSGKKHLLTRYHPGITVREENAAAALEIMSRFAVDPRWLIYLPPTMSPPRTAPKGSPTLEHPREVFAYFRENGVQRLICEEKHMGSRAVIVLPKDATQAEARFGIRGEGAIYTRTGRPFFSDQALETALLLRLREAAAPLFERLSTTWLCLDAELLPWSAKAQALLRQQYAAVGTTAANSLTQAVAALKAAPSPEASALLARFEKRSDQVARYRQAYAHYVWPTDGIQGLKVAPFHLLASEGAVHVNQPHTWHLMQLAGLADRDPALCLATQHRLVDLQAPESEAEATTWWERLTQTGGEGMVVKPMDWLVRGPHGWVQPAIKCRGPEYLRIIYGPEYLDQLDDLRARGLGLKRSLALRELALGLEALHRFVEKEPLYRVHECVFAVLALESEPVDPRL